MALSGTAVVMLGLLALRPRSGYEIKQAVDGSTRYFWSASYGQIYPELRRLAKAGLVEAEDAPTGARRRTVYRITAAGRDEFQAWLADPGFGLEVRDESLLKLFFADLLTSEQALALVRARRAVHHRWLAQLRAIDAGPPFVGGRAFPDVVLAYGIDFSEWAASWWEAMERRLIAREASEP
jgi:PadR family transcriptional regulator, regulatory protein AphA